MGVVISNRVYKNDFDSSEVDFLVGNFGTWIEHSFDVDVSILFEGSLSETVSFPNPTTLVLNNGKNWKDYGFKNGQSFNFDYDYWNGTTTTNETSTQNIVAINGNQLIHDGNIFDNDFIIYPGNAGTKKVSNLKIYSTEILEAVSLKYGLIKNSDNQNDSLSSVIDGTETELIGKDLDLLAIAGETDLFSIGLQSGMAINYAKIKYVSVTGISRKYTVTIQFMIHGLYDNLSDFSLGVVPDWFLGSECLTDNINIKFLPEYNNPNVSISNKMEWSRQLGNTGYLSENYNGLVNPFKVESLSYWTSLTGPTTSLFHNIETRLIATISGLTDPTNINVKLGYGILWATQDSDVYKSNINEYHKNLKVNTEGDGGFGTSSRLVTDPVDLTLKESFSNDLAKININSIDYEVVGSNIVMTMKVLPSTEFSDMIKNNPTDNKYFIWLSIGDATTPINEANRVTLPIDFNSFEEYSGATSEYDYFDYAFFDHGRDANNPVTVPTCNLEAFVEDDVLVKSRIAVDYNDLFNIENVTFKIEMKNTGDGSVFALDQKSVNVSSFPTDIDGIQQINFLDSKGFKYIAGNDKNLIKIVRNSSLDDYPLYYYEMYYGFKIRWEYWLSKANVPSAFYKAIELNGFANNWYDYYLTSGYEMVFALYMTGTRNGQSVSYRNESSVINLMNYNNQSLSSREIKTFDNSTGLEISAGIDPETGLNTNVILGSGYTRVEAYFNDYPIDPIQLYGTICLEVWRGAGQYEFRQLSSITGSESDNPLIPLSGESYAKVEVIGDDIIVKCLIDPTLLINATKFKLSSRIGCYQESCEGLTWTDGSCLLTTNDINLIPE